MIAGSMLGIRPAHLSTVLKASILHALAAAERRAAGNGHAVGSEAGAYESAPADLLNASLLGRCPFACLLTLASIAVPYSLCPGLIASDPRLGLSACSMSPCGKCRIERLASVVTTMHAPRFPIPAKGFVLVSIFSPTRPCCDSHKSAKLTQALASVSLTGLRPVDSLAPATARQKTVRRVCALIASDRRPRARGFKAGHLNGQPDPRVGPCDQSEDNCPGRPDERRNLPLSAWPGSYVRRCSMNIACIYSADRRYVHMPLPRHRTDR